MQQRVAIAQALIMQPKILLMDEAFSALDPATRADMQALVRRLWAERGTTILFVTHNIAEAVHLGTRVVVLAREPGDEGGANVVLDMALPEPSHTPAEWRKSKQFAELVEHLETNSRRPTRRACAPQAIVVAETSTGIYS
jgi:NitT/TauT family transport system ATP-binding protein